jgi:hypothetical protein
LRFSEFLRTTVTISAASATVLAALTLIAAERNADLTLVVVALVWWAAAIVIGTILGRHNRISPPIRRLLADARTQMLLPELQPTRTMMTRLWPILVYTIVAGACIFLVPQVAAVAAGFPAVWAFAWRRQASAVTAIEQRDGARFYVDRTPPFAAVRLVRTPGLRANLPPQPAFGSRQTARRGRA